MTMREAQRRLRKTLIDATAKAQSSVELKDATQALREALLTFGSETPDNVQCAQHVEFGWVRRRRFGPSDVMGLKIRGKPVLISDLIHAIEDAVVPRKVQRQYPTITADDWAAARRLVTLILLAFQQTHQAPSKRRGHAQSS